MPAELRSGARFCTKCGQRVIDETPAAETPGPDSAPRNEWTDWYSPGLPTTSAGAPSPAAPVSASMSPSASPSASASPSVSSTAAEQQAASNVAGMLASSVTDRTAINNAYNDVYGCGPNLHADAAVFTCAVSSRRALLASLATMPGRAALPPTLLTDLTSAWQASVAADQGLATWASDEVAKGCVAGDTKDPGYQTTITPDNEATEYKTDFTDEWNPIAERYGLTTYQQSQLSSAQG